MKRHLVMKLVSFDDIVLTGPIEAKIAMSREWGQPIGFLPVFSTKKSAEKWAAGVAEICEIETI